MKTFAEIRSDLGGLRLTLESRGYACLESQTWDELLQNCSISAGRKASKKKENIFNCDILAVQFPMSDTVGGLWSPEGDWISVRHVAVEIENLIHSYKPQSLMFTGRNCVFSERNGSSFAELLISLSNLGYESCWFSLNLASIGLPQDANRMALLAVKSKLKSESKVQESPSKLLLSNILCIEQSAFRFRGQDSLERLLKEREPRIGMPAPKNSNPYGRCGVAINGFFQSFNYRVPIGTSIFPSLSNVLGLESSCLTDSIHSARFVSRKGVQSLQLKRGFLAHSLGPSISALPLFAFSRRRNLLPKLERMLNWSSSFGDYDVGRLTPQRSLLLFGSRAASLASNLNKYTSSMTSQYRLVAATVAPRFAELLIVALEGVSEPQSIGESHEIH